MASALETVSPETGASPSPKLQVPKKKRKWLKRLIILLVVAAVAVGLVLVLTRKNKNAASTAFLPAQVARRDLSVTVTGTGTISPNDDYRATTLLQGKILTAPFEEGDLVEKDQVLFTLDPTDAENNIDTAESGVERAKLAQDQAAAGVEQAALGVTQAQLALEQAQLNLRSLEKTDQDNVDDMAIKATAAGVISKLYVDPGDTVVAGSPIADILDRDTMELEVPFHAVTAAQFFVGEAATVTVSGTAATLPGTITELGAASSVTSSGAVVRSVTIQVSNPGALTPDSTGTAQVGAAASADVGTFRYAASSQVVALTSGKVDRLSVSEGSLVSDRQVIGSFELPDLSDQLDNARLAVENAQASVDNAKLAQNTAQVSYANAQLAVRDAQDALDIARDALDDFTITSPISGTVIEKNYKAGDNVNPSSASAGGSAYMAVIYDLSLLTFDMNVSELDVAQLAVGQKVTFTSDALEGQTFTGHVDKINLNGTTVSGSTNYPVTVVVDNGEGLYPGMNVSATILVEELGEVLTLPVDAIQRPNTVYVAAPGALNDKGELVDSTKLEERQVELGRNDSDFIEILSGLEEGDTVYIPNATSDTMQTMMQLMGG